MAKYRISVSIDGENYFWIVVDNGKLIKNPTKEDLKGTKLKSYNRTNICPRCREENNITDNSMLYPHNARRDKDESGKETEWICNRHYFIDYQILPNSHNNIMKSMRSCRTGKFSICTDNGKGLIGKAVVAKVRKLKILSLKMNNFCYKFDLSKDEKYGIIQVKTASIGPIYHRWEHGRFSDINFDTAFLICMDRNMINIVRIYIIPKEEFFERINVQIYENPSRGTWYDNIQKGYMINEKPYNDMYHDLISFIGNKEFFSAEDIDVWLNK